MIKTPLHRKYRRSPEIVPPSILLVDKVIVVGHWLLKHTHLNFVLVCLSTILFNSRKANAMHHVLFQQVKKTKA